MWYVVRDAEGNTVGRVFAQTIEDLDANTPAGCEAAPDIPPTE